MARESLRLNLSYRSGSRTEDHRNVLKADDARRHRGDATESVDSGTDVGHRVNERPVPELHFRWKVCRTINAFYAQHMVVNW